MTLRDMVAQLVILPCYGEAPNAASPEYVEMLRWVREAGIGGLVVINRVESGLVRHSQPHAMAAFLNRMQRAARIPLIVAGDFERGASMRVETRTKFPHAMAFAATRDPAESRFAGEVTAREARALGIHWIFAPVADVNNNPDNPIINIRSYGENPEDVAAHVRAFIEGARAAKPPVLVTAKHFPGHGDTATDTHMNLAVVAAGRERLDQVELVPFRAAIAQGVDAVMSAHIALPALGAREIPSTLASSVLTGLLREQLGFRGLVVTDALDMQGVSKGWSSGEAAVKALEAGADVLLMPVKPQEAIDAVVSAVQQNRISRKRIEESVARILNAKIRVGLDRRRLVDLEAISEELDRPEVIGRVQQIADRAVTLVKNEGAAIPLRPDSPAGFLILPENRLSPAGRAFHVELFRRMPEAQAAILEPQFPECALEPLVSKLEGCDPVVVVAFASVAAYRGSVALLGNYPKLIHALLERGRRVVLVSMGNPYLLRGFPGVAAYLATYSTAPPSELAAVKALFGEIPIQGRLPVTIPGFARHGDGIQLRK